MNMIEIVMLNYDLSAIKWCKLISEVDVEIDIDIDTGFTHPGQVAPDLADMPYGA